MREASAVKLSAKASHVFSTKNIGTFEILNETLTNDIITFEQQVPEIFFVVCIGQWLKV